MKTSEIYFCLASDGLIYNLGEHRNWFACHATAENMGLNVIWIFGEANAKAWRDILNHHFIPQEESK